METEEEQKQQAIPAEDEEGNFKLLFADKILDVKSEVEDDPDSAAIFYYEDGKTYQYIHSEKAMAQFNEWMESGEDE
ncbi:hypothetical protein [Paenibacillus pini]|uniref:DUF1292 domain-containing protein n=1 Tax=Paenibacillus pini JCM 16418 TaxID=1236976 RepID=W7Z455_9BACL|nr:hypothetical protein [Paenibacillus pini]GAF09129.1 hypothetical protein JCM16418_3249 [Paenibacillus pini JCM 16418]